MPPGVGVMNEKTQKKKKDRFTNKTNDFNVT